MTDYGICKKFVSYNVKFLFPPPCPECNEKRNRDSMFKNYVHDIVFVSDYVTHRIGYHNANHCEVYADLICILNNEECATRGHNKHDIENPCCKCGKYGLHRCCETKSDMKERLDNLEAKLDSIRLDIQCQIADINDCKNTLANLRDRCCVE